MTVLITFREINEDNFDAILAMKRPESETFVCSNAKSLAQCWLYRENNDVFPYAIYADETQLALSTVASGVIFPDTYYKTGNNIGINLKKPSEKLKIIYFVKPELKNADNISELNVMLPYEFIDLAKAKLRGEAYKIANEGDIAAMWLNDYNILLETFKAWISGKKPEFGL